MESKFTRIITALLLCTSIAGPFAVQAAQPHATMRSTPVATGDTAPDFTLQDQNGRPFTLSSEWKSQPVVLIFYRGYW